MTPLRAFLIPLAVTALIVMACCGPSGPTEADMGMRPISSREVPTVLLTALR